MAQFPQGVKEDDITKTTWHQVVAFNQRAAQVRDSLTKGDPVEVIGYVYEQAIARRDGTTRTLHEIYATVIKPRSSASPHFEFAGPIAAAAGSRTDAPR